LCVPASRAHIDGRASRDLRWILISVPEGVAANAQRAVDVGLADSLSDDFVGLAIIEPDWALAREVADGLIDEIGGIDLDARAWVRSVLGLADDGNLR
jgi:hypothetical protein